MNSFLLELSPEASPAPQAGARPQLGFLGVGWIGRHRLEAIARSGVAEIAAVADASPDLAAEAARLVGGAKVGSSMEELLSSSVDAVVIATPSALHADQTITALRRRKPVFCQKPLGRNAAETRRVVDAAREADLLLGVDLSYRFIPGLRLLHELCRGGDLGEIYVVDLEFHNAYGPDKAWFYDREKSGGGCVVDLGIHLVDLAFWNLGFPRTAAVSSRLFAQGKPLKAKTHLVEDYAIARVDLETGGTVRLACSWKLSAGCDAMISGAFYGTKGAAAFQNVNGSFYEFITERFQGTRREVLARDGEGWGGKAAVEWARRLSVDGRYDPADAEQFIQVAEVLDAIYEGGSEEVGS